MLTQPFQDGKATNFKTKKSNDRQTRMHIQLPQFKSGNKGTETQQSLFCFFNFSICFLIGGRWLYNDVLVSATQLKSVITTQRSLPTLQVLTGRRAGLYNSLPQLSFTHHSVHMSVRLSQEPSSISFKPGHICTQF